MKNTEHESETSGISKAGLVLVFATLTAMLLHQIFHVSMGWFLDPIEYGELGIAMSILLIAGFLLQHGFPQTVSRFLASDWNEGAAAFKTGLMANFLLGMLLSILVYFTVTQWFAFGEGYQRIVPLLVISTMILSVGFILRYALQGIFRFTQMGIIDVAQIGVGLIFASVFAVRGWGSYGAVLGLVTGHLTILLLAAFFLRGSRILTVKRWANPSVYNFAASMLLGNLAIILIVNIDILGLKLFVNETDSGQITGHYRSASILARIPFGIVAGLMAAVFAFIARAKDADEYIAYINRMFKYALIFCFPAAIVLVSIPESILGLFFPESYRSAASSLQILALGLGPLAFVQILTQTLQARGMPKIPAFLLPIAVLFQCILLVVLVPSMGMNGAAIATSGACFLGLILLLTMFKRIGKIPFNLATLRIIPVFGILGIFLYYFPHSTRMLTLLDLVLGGVIYLLMLIMMKFVTERDIEIIGDSLPRLRGVNGILEAVTSVVNFLNIEWPSKTKGQS